MKKILLLLLLTATSYAGPMIAWDASPSPNIASYRVYDMGEPTADPPVPVLLVAVADDILEATIPETTPPVKNVAVTAVNEEGLESVISNVLTIEPPAPPANLRIVITVQVSSDLKEWEDRMVIYNDPDDPLKFWRLLIGVEEMPEADS